MIFRKSVLFAVVVVLVTLHCSECRRFGGGGGRRTGGGSRPRPSPPSYHPSPPSYHPSPPSYHPSPPAHIPSPPAQHPAPKPVNDHFGKASAPPAESAGTRKDIGWVQPNHNTNVKPLGTNPGQHPAPSAPVGPPIHNNPVGNGVAPPYSPGNYHPPAYNPGPPPPYHPGGYPQQPGNYHPPPYHPGGYPQQPGGYHPPAYYPGGYPQQHVNYPGSYHPPGVTIINNNMHSYSPPSYPSYHYSSSDTGSGTLGFFLGYSLAKITTPTYHYHTSSFYDGYSPRYDHYTVHHYYHNREVIEKEKVIESNTIIGCVGDSGTICPANTTSLCTSNGAIMCVASATTTVPCKNDKETNCIKTTIPCVDKNTPECKGVSENSTTVSIPCISNAKIYGTVTYVNNTIVVENANTTGTNLTTNSTINANSTSSNITTTPVPITTTPVPTTTTAAPVKKEPQNFCVTILALPATREQTEGEKVFDQAENVFENFLVKAFGID